jgi:triacylglycerol lipase
MIARLQRAYVATLLTFAAAWFAYFANRNQPSAAVAGTCLMLFSYAAVLALQFALMYAKSRILPPTARPHGRQLLAAWGAEALVVPLVFFWRQPFRSTARPDLLPAVPAHGRGVVLVHGFACNRGLWNPWMRRLEARDVPFVAVNLEPVAGSIDDYPLIIDAAMRQMESHTGLPPVLVGHSMGGLAIRAWLRQFNADARVHRIVTIGSPHHGTWLARFGHTRNGRQMRLSSAWLADLQAAEPSSRYARFTCFYGHCDNIVFPAQTATLLGAENIHVAATAHVQMAFQEVVFTEVCRWLTAPPSEPGASDPRGRTGTVAE